MTLQNLNSAFKHRSLVLHFRCLLGGLGHHFGSFGGPFWEPKSFILDPWGGPFGFLNACLAHLGRGIRQHPLQRPWFGSIFEAIFASFFDDF